ncbi:kinase-like domain-containing protein [Aspergillus stella-maris]|uniref:kinase-like domain-containing protein n=1 Tax=Aspergillus stella-maris TaxID=1810926 RepID=UPI003CCD5DA1
MVGGKFIRKGPRSESPDDLEPIAREAQIYSLIRPHPRIVECMSMDRVDRVDLKFYQYDDIATYRKEKGLTPELQADWFRQIIEAIVVIHSRGIIHSDLALRQYFFDASGRLQGFADPDHPALGYEKASHCLPRDYTIPNSEKSDIFATGSTLYELFVGKEPYAEIWASDPEPGPRDYDAIRAQVYRQHQAGPEIEKRFKEGRFPDVSDVFRGDVISGCWRGEYSSALQVLELYAA